MSSSSRPIADDWVPSRDAEALSSPSHEHEQNRPRAGRHASLHVLNPAPSQTNPMWPQRDLPNPLAGSLPSSSSLSNNIAPSFSPGLPPAQFEPHRYGITSFPVSNMPAEARRQSIMAMDRKRRLTGSAHESGRRRNIASGFDDRGDSSYSRPLNAGSSSSRTVPAHQQHNIGANAGPEVIDLTVSPPRTLRQQLDQPRRPSASSPGGYVVPTWQPDSEVAECPICHRPFSFLFRRHHCRKCGRVICNDCSPHRITIPRQFIVNPPGPFAQNLLDSRDTAHFHSDDDETGDHAFTLGNTMNRQRWSQNPALGGGEKVRLCNPCVPDPQPESHPMFGAATLSLPRPERRDDLLTLSDALRSSRQDVQPNSGTESFPGIAQQYPLPLTTHPNRPRHFSTSLQPSSSVYSAGAPQVSLPYLSQDRNHLRAFIPSDPRLATHHRYHSLDDPQTQALVLNRPRNRSMLEDSLAPRPNPRQMAHARPQLNEEDICPVCRRALPPKGSGGNEAARESHIMACINARDPSTQNSVRGQGLTQSPLRGPVHMLPFTATEKDCVGEDGNVGECSICMVEYDVGDQLARLECLCKFHRECISEWFMRKQECPVHKIA